MLQYIRGHGSSDTHAEMEFLLTKKGGRALIFEGHKYVVNRRGRDVGVTHNVFTGCPRADHKHIQATSVSTAIHS